MIEVSVGDGVGGVATLRGIVGSLVQWSQAHLPEIDSARARYDRREPSFPARG